MSDAEKPALDLDRIEQRIDRWLFRHWPQRLRRDVTPSSEEQVIHDDMVTLIARVRESARDLARMTGIAERAHKRALRAEKELAQMRAAIERLDDIDMCGPCELAVTFAIARQPASDCVYSAVPGDDTWICETHHRDVCSGGPCPGVAVDGSIPFS